MKVTLAKMLRKQRPKVPQNPPHHPNLVITREDTGNARTQFGFAPVIRNFIIKT